MTKPQSPARPTGTGPLPGSPAALARAAVSRPRPASAGEAGFARAHFVGIGGAGMSGVARILLAAGVPVSGSDTKESRNVEALRSLGAVVHIGHDAAHVRGASRVVTSNALRDDNPEVRAARELGLPVVHRAGALAAVMAGGHRVAVAGTAGKTSTTGMLTVIARQCGTDPSFAAGANLGGAGTNAHRGNSPLFIAESDESDSSFLLLEPDTAIVTNVGDDDHIDLHGTAEDYARAFERFVERLPADGLLVAGVDDPGAARLADHARGRVRVRTYGESPGADLRLSGLTVGPEGTVWDAALDGVPLPPVRLRVPGRHMALNSAAALLTAVELGFSARDAIGGLAAYQGVARRFEFKGEAAGVRVYDDYAHNPTKVREQLRAARFVAGEGRLVVAFQPPLFTTTRRFPAEFGAALGLADEVVVSDVSRAREEPLPGVTGELIARRIPLPGGHVTYCPEAERFLPVLRDLVRPGDLVLTMGTGDITTVGPRLLDELARRGPAVAEAARIPAPAAAGDGG
ncbi:MULTISPECIES: UDP-N-acetylmuramate--L-alanine ligase [Streptomyces]|uniref:UDP-N-acetylmuramate--L-alanine ligase n=1 Tax=Streptomyces lycii TaxID=2654337 RepID=A0ABQ7FHK1_9ACTN|nr:MULTISPECIES: UDP-N-acetylmuramate--L-alanine ligase [Streptomyces]KAF4408402.1 UDP-N-acetylmuramate--L-alanine ligase [Streptomyces lycii]PGH52655.1 UDP-N-acetylmuramate--L-alanine ligase [Streptomyces sp. Ru87]